MLNWYSSQILLSYTHHAHLGWLSNQALAFKPEYTWLPISLSEMAEASAHLPIVIMRYQQRWLMVVLLNGSSPEEKIINIESLKRVFLPQCVKAYPFSLIYSEEANNGFQLGIDPQCLVPLQDEGALPLFNRNRQYSAAVTENLHLLHRLKIDSEIVHSACELLAKKGLLALISDVEKINVEIKERAIPLYRVDIDAIGRLPREDFADLQMHHAMALGIYQHSSLFHSSFLHSSLLHSSLFNGDKLRLFAN